ncbi:MAG: pantoate--beta-alanine ligase [Halobacteriovoraceae bacterium]|nr:pantoate--beta-alanine ligase [Halobacteriovoraceae bacterium]|tara:strand:- start:40560 stop:41423 length:864 start_codon:yes stop_codon:yes gene_type:complete
MLYFCSTIEEFNTLRSKLRPKQVGLVPTMGNLHDGHMSLVEKSLQENELTVVSIFVNPIQFAKGEDFETYPRSLEEDLQKIEKTISKFKDEEKTVIVFAPSDEGEIYPKGFNDHVSAGKLGRILEGEVRPKHFDGVVTVVKRLFKITNPKIAYFGNKDFQQVTLIRLMSEKEGLKVKVEGMPIVREKSGLAMSSRNSYLGQEQKVKGLALYNSLQEISNLIKKGEGPEAVQVKINEILNRDKSFNYIEVRNANDLSVPKKFEGKLVVLGNYQVNKVRLIDNIEVEVK